MIVVLILSILLNGALGYACWNLLRKNEVMEDAIDIFYTRLDTTLKTMRVIDSRQMFEKDDEVGSVFNQVVDIVNDLRPLLYGSNTEDGEKENEAR
jgi:hypothetical protein